MSLRHGDFAGTGYTYGVYSDPSPERLALLSLMRGQRPVDPAGPFRLLELACGQGFHLCLQALERKPMHDGQAMEGAERLKILETMVAAFCRSTMPLMGRLGVLS